VALTKEQLPEDVAEIPTWEQDLQKVGLVRRALRARKWYGADWWFVAISSVMVVGFIILALFPDLLRRMARMRSLVRASWHQAIRHLSRC
jgi:cytochrome c biogenesis protein ResB